MALLYHRAKVDIACKDVVIRAIDDNDYQVAITFTEEEDEDEVITEVLLTKAEVQECNDVLFNR